MYLSGVIYIRYVCVYRYCNTTDIKLADRFSRAVNFFFFFDKVTRLAGWQVVFFFKKNKDKNKYARRCAYLMHKVLRYRYHSLLCIVDSSSSSFFIL